MTEQSDDFTMTYQDSCDQVPLLLIHGFPLNSGMWEPQFDDLSGHARIIAPDLRGHGRTDALAGPYTVEMLANDCAGLLEHLGVNRPVVVCGLSMGGYIAFEFYRQFPDYVAGLILASTRAGADTVEGRANRDKAAAKARDEGVAAVAADMLPKLVSPKTAETDSDLLSGLRQMMEETAVDGMVGALMAMKERPDSTPMLADIDVPTLVIHGTDDQLIPPSEAEAMHAAIKDSKLVLIAGAGHLPNLEQPDDFNDAVIDFLESLAGEEEA